MGPVCHVEVEKNTQLIPTAILGIIKSLIFAGQAITRTPNDYFM